MGVEYSLIIAGEVPVEEVAECAVPDLAQHATPAVSARQVSADLYESLGFWLSVRSARDGYFEDDLSGEPGYRNLWVGLYGDKIGETGYYGDSVFYNYNGGKVAARLYEIPR